MNTDMANNEGTDNEDVIYCEWFKIPIEVPNTAAYSFEVEAVADSFLACCDE